MASPRRRTVTSEHDRSETQPGGKVTSYFEQRDRDSRDAKRAIAKYVVDELLEEGDSILLDAGTSLYPIAEQIVSKAEKEPQSTHFTIMTHNYQAFQVLVGSVLPGANLNIVLAGGRYDRDLNALFGPQTIMAYDHFFPRVVLIGISGIVADQGLFCHGNTEELSVKERIFKKSAHDRIIIADCTKLGLPDAFRFGESQDFRDGVEDCILVTNAPDPDDNELIQRFPGLLKRFEEEKRKLIETYGLTFKVVPGEYFVEFRKPA
jgi:DeoR/GlpR family transcriptional regulator of sugar metabolism